LDILNAAASVEDLRSPPRNHLEKLFGDLKEFHSVRINQQWRLIFRWIDGRAEEVEINELVKGKRGVTPDTAWLLSKAL
jgi:proteic killer suppression protein